MTDRSYTEYAAQLSGVSVTYPTAVGEVHALEAVSHGFPVATSTALQGRSGSGKSTLISVLALLRKPTGGTVLIDGVDVSTLRERRLSEIRGSSIGVVFQSFHLDPRAFERCRHVRMPSRTSRFRGCSRREACTAERRRDSAPNTCSIGWVLLNSVRARRRRCPGGSVNVSP